MAALHYESNSTMAALLEEAKSGAQQQFVVFVCEDGEGTNVTKINVHAPIARVLSDLVLTAQCTKVGAERDSREITVPFSARVMERVRGYMYGAPLRLETLGDAVEFLTVASFLIMPELQGACMSVVEGCIYTEKYTLDSLVSIWLLICETGIDGPVELVRVALVKVLMANCAVDMKNPVIAKLIEVTTLPDLVRLTCGLEGRRVMCVHLAIELALMWGNVHAEQPDGAEQKAQKVLAHIDLDSLPKCCVKELEDRGLIPEHAALEAPNSGKRQKSNQRVGAWWTGRVGEDVCAVGLCGPKMLVEALRGFPFNCAGNSVHTPQVVRVEGPSCSYLTFPFLRPLGALECTEPEQASNPNSLMLMQYSPPPPQAFQTGYVLAAGGSGRWLPFGIIPPFMGNRDSRYAAAARGTRICFVKMCGTGADCALFDVKTCTWAQLPPLLVSRSWPCIAMTDAHLYVIGGGQTERLCVTGLTPVGLNGLPSVGLKWEDYGPCVFRTKSAAVSVGPFIYVVGGVCQETSQMSAAVTRISTVDGSRIELPAMIERRMCPGAFAQEGPEGGRVCIIGGMETYHVRRPVRAESLAVDDAEPKWQPLEVQLGRAK